MAEAERRDKDGGQRHRDRAAARSREQSAAVSELGPLPRREKIPGEKKACGLSLFSF